MYFKDKVEQEQVKLFLGVLRAKEAGLSVVQVRQTTERAFGNVDVEKVVDDDMSAEPKSEDALPSNSEREIPVTLRPFISQGWDLDTAFRIYDEWHADMSKITDKTSYVKSLYERFIEERKKQYADESAE
jgi:hypothetical protein